MMVTIRGYTVEEFGDMLEGYREAADIRATVLHHTYSPCARDYKGLETIEAIRRYHLQRGWTDIGCHAYVAPDGCVYNGRPPTARNAACHYGERPPEEWPEELRRLAGEDRGWANRHGFGIEVIGNFDDEDPVASRAMQTALDLLAVVHTMWRIPVSHCFMHRDLARKSCPGRRVRKEWVHRELERRLAMQQDVAEWAREAVAWVRKEGLMSGYPDGSFRGGEPVSRQELAVILFRLARWLQKSTAK